MLQTLTWMTVPTMTAELLKVTMKWNRENKHGKNGVILVIQYDKRWGLTFQNYRNIKIAAGAIQIPVSMHGTLRKGIVSQINFNLHSDTHPNAS